MSNPQQQLSRLEKERVRKRAKQARESSVERESRKEINWERNKRRQSSKSEVE